MSKAAERMRRKWGVESKAETNERLSKAAKRMRCKQDAESEAETKEIL